MRIKQNTFQRNSVIKVPFVIIVTLLFSYCASRKKTPLLEIDASSVKSISFENRGIDSMPSKVFLYKKNDIERIIKCIKKSSQVYKPRVNINYGLMECTISAKKEIEFLIIKTEFDGTILRYEDDFLIPHYYRNDSLFKFINNGL